MKMRLNIKYILAFSVITLTGCDESWVDTKPNGEPTTAFFWKSEEDVKRGLAAMYRPMDYENLWGRNLFWMQNASDDLVTGRVRAESDNIKNFNITGREGGIANCWNDLYWMMNKANQALEGLPTATVSEALKNRALGEAYFIRAFSHFWIAYTWGHKDLGVPFDGPENPEYGKRVPPQLTSVTENYAQIIKDLEKAADLLPLYSTYGSSDLGRAHKVAAWGYMVKTYAYWAQYDASKWALIPALCDKIKNEGGRALITGKGSPKANYQAVFTVENNWSSEYIWSVTSGVQGGSIFPGVVLENKGWGIFNGWGYFQPTQELYDAYEQNDPRREVTILKFGDKFDYFGKERRYFSTNSLSGFQIRKYMEPYGYGSDEMAGTNNMINQNGDGPSTRLNLPLMRYAEILLFKAEALIQQGKNTEAAAPINEIRARVGLGALATVNMADLKHERRVELACEWTDRLADLKRWGDFDKIRMPLHGRIHTNKTDPDSPYEIGEIWPARSFDPAKYMAWPVNPDEIARSNGAYKQTPGW